MLLRWSTVHGAALCAICKPNQIMCAPLPRPAVPPLLSLVKRAHAQVVSEFVMKEIPFVCRHTSLELGPPRHYDSNLNQAAYKLIKVEYR